MTVIVSRGAGHPWTASAGWDQMMLLADTREELDDLVNRAKEKFWKVWFAASPIGTETFCAHMFKPSDATREWQDISWQGTPRGHGHQFKVDDEVYTDYSGRITRHRIRSIEMRPISQTGIMLRVWPPVPKSGHVADDRGGDGREFKAPPMDAAWFRKVES